MQQTIKLPHNYQRTAYYPTTYAGTRPETKEYVVTLGNLTMQHCVLAVRDVSA